MAMDRSAGPTKAPRFKLPVMTNARWRVCTLGKKVRVTKCLYSKKGMPWLRFSSLVRSVMSVCSSAKPVRQTSSCE